MGFVYEGIRHAYVVPGLHRVVANDITVMDGPRGPVHLKAGRTILIATSRSSMDPVAFPEPEKLNPHRPFSDYIIMGVGFHYCLGARFVTSSLVASLKAVFKLKNLRRAPGPQGHFTKTVFEFAGVKMIKYLDVNAAESPIPTTLTLEYDE